MNLQSATDPRLAETVFRVVQNSSPLTAAASDGTIALNSPVVLETATASLPSTMETVGQNFVKRPATLTSIVNNLFVGLVARVAGTKQYLERDEVGLAQCYGPNLSAIVQRVTDALTPGAVLVPDSLQFLVGVGGPVTGAGTGSNVVVPALGGFAYLMEALASSSATGTSTAKVFLRCM